MIDTESVMGSLTRFLEYYWSFDPELAKHVQRSREAAMQQLMDASELEPMVYPYRLLPGTLVFLYLMLPPTNSPAIYYARYPLAAFVIFQAVDAIRFCRNPMTPIGYAYGIMNSMTIVWTICILLCTDARGDYSRIEKSCPRVESDVPLAPLSEVAGSAHISRTTAGLRRRPNEKSVEKDVAVPSLQPKSDYRWQSLPPSFCHRLDWVVDLCTSCRGSRWSWGISTVEPPPEIVQRGLPPDSPVSFPPATAFSIVTPRQLATRYLRTIILCALGLDLLRPLYMQDTYFWGLGRDMPSPFPFKTSARVLLTFLNALFGINLLFGVPLFIQACLLGPRLLGEHGWPWLYSPVMGSFSDIMEKGLGGTWACWWHQMLRSWAETPGEAIARLLGGKWRRGTQRGMILRLVVAFSVSGFVHAAGSYSTGGPHIRPIRGTFCFFMLQALGIFLQRFSSQALKTSGVRAHLPQWFRKLGNLVFVLLWFRFTGPLITDDMTANGIFLYDLLPFSFVLGVSRGQWWHGRTLQPVWFSGKHWWQSGVHFL